MCARKIEKYSRPVLAHEVRYPGGDCSGTVVAVDIHPRKLARLEAERARLQIPCRVETHTVDLTGGLGGLTPASFDRVLCDAPCTGLGTIHRRPELALRLEARDPARLAELQRALVVRARELVRPSGTLVLSTCSAAFEEGAGLADVFDDEPEIHILGPWGDVEMDVYHVLRWSPVAELVVR